MNMVIHLGPAIVEKTGKVLCVSLSGFPSVIFPLCFWVDGVFSRVSRLLSWKPSKLPKFLVETSDSIQVFLEPLNKNYHGNKEFNNFVLDAHIIVPSVTSEYSQNGSKWIVRKKNHRNHTAYPYVILSHFTEGSKIPVIESSGECRSSKWALSRTRKIEISFCYLTDLTEIKYSWDFFSIAMIRENYPEMILWETDDGMLVTCEIRKENRELDAKLDFLVDMRLVSPNPVIAHNKNSEEWWEVFMPNIFRIACKSIKLKKNGKFYRVEKNSVNNFIPSKGFSLADGYDPSQLQAMIEDTDVKQFFI